MFTFIKETGNEAAEDSPQSPLQPNQATWEHTTLRTPTLEVTSNGFLEKEERKSSIHIETFPPSFCKSEI